MRGGTQYLSSTWLLNVLLYSFLSLMIKSISDLPIVVYPSKKSSKFSPSHPLLFKQNAVTVHTYEVLIRYVPQAGDKC